ncbi:MAG: hypothetical protein ACI8WB_002502 [Phenylobacterium sp.]
MANKRLSIVIDADIARSSGLSEHPTSSSARLLLENVRENGHYIAMSPDLRIEWKKHKSLLATRWLASMVAKKRVKFIKPDTTVNDYISDNVSDEKIKSIAIKDAHLVDAALSQDNIIVSNDDNARRAFCVISANYGPITAVMWFHSVTDKPFVSGYLQSLCFVPEHYYLKAF